MTKNILLSEIDRMLALVLLTVVLMQTIRQRKRAEFMQNFVNWYGPTIRSDNAFYLPAGNPKVSFVDVRDIAAVAVKTLTDDDISDDRHKGKAYLITGPEALSYYQAAEILSEAAFIVSWIERL